MRMWCRPVAPHRWKFGILQQLPHVSQLQRSIHVRTRRPLDHLSSRPTQSFVDFPSRAFEVNQTFRCFSLKTEPLMTSRPLRRKGDNKVKGTVIRQVIDNGNASVTVLKSVPIELLPKVKMPPVELLKKYYLNNCKTPTTSIKACFQNSLLSYVDENGRAFQVWHSCFTCPVSGTVFPAGKLQGSTTVLLQVPPGGTEGYHYYPKRKESEQAAAARALDALDRVSPMLCVYNESDPLIPLLLESAAASKKETSTASNDEPKPTAAEKNVKSESSTGEYLEKATIPSEAKNVSSTCADKDNVLIDPNLFYRREFQMQISLDNYKSKQVQSSGIVGWTSVFTCPLSGTLYPSGTVKAAEVLPNHGGKDDTRVFYRNRRDAELAAGKWAVDVLRYQTLGIRVPRHCLEDPAQIFGPAGHAKKKQVASNLSEENVNKRNSDLKGTKDTSASTDSSPRATKSSPASKDFNNNKATNATGQQKLHVTAVNASLDKQKKSEKKPAGLLVNFLSAVDALPETHVNGSLSADESGTAGERCLEGSDSGLIPTKVFSENGGDTVPAVPSAFAASPSYQTTARSTSIVSPMELTYEDDNDEYGIVSNLSSTFGVSPVDRLFESSNENVEQSSDDENDGVVSVIPSVVGLSPAHRLLASFEDVQSASSQFRNVATHKRMDVVLQAAEAWLASNSQSLDVEDSPHRVTLPQKDSGKRLFLANTILSALAKVAQTTPICTSTSFEGVAKRILDSLWKTKDSYPNADSYNYFLKCIGGSNPVVSLEIAEAIVDAMFRGAKHKTSAALLPKPNQSTFNTLIQITAQIGGESGRYPKHTDRDVDFTPDRESFLSILSSCIYSPAVELEYGGFDRPFAEECIKRMAQLAVQFGNDSLLPDTTVYNAPLRWTGGPILWMESRPYARFLNWDNYKQLFATKGKILREHLDENHHFVQQARAMESWLETMETLSAENSNVSPNVETYEAVIQAWLRTSSREGLDRAQDVLRKLLNCYNGETSLRPRLQTFHPVLAALYHAKQDDSASKILAWIEEWEKLSTDSEADFDSRLVEMKLVTLLQAQSELLGNGSNSKLPTDKRRAEIVTKAISCSEVVDVACCYLERISTIGPLESQPLDVDYFLQAACAWEKVAALGAEIKDPQLTRDAVSGMMRLFERFETIVQSCIQNTSGVSLKEKKLNPQLNHFVATSHVFFCRLVMQLSLLHETKDRPDIVLVLEKMTRVVGEFAEIEALCLSAKDTSASSKQPNPNVPKPLALPNAREQPDDLFDYQIRKENSRNSSRIAFLWQVVKFLDEPSTENAAVDVSDILRIIVLVKEISSSRQQSGKMVEYTDRILYRLRRQVAANRDSVLDEGEEEASTGKLVPLTEVEEVVPKKSNLAPNKSKSLPPPRKTTSRIPKISTLRGKTTQNSMTLKNVKQALASSNASISRSARRQTRTTTAASKPMKVNGAL